MVKEGDKVIVKSKKNGIQCPQQLINHGQTSKRLRDEGVTVQVKVDI